MFLFFFFWYNLIIIIQLLQKEAMEAMFLDIRSSQLVGDQWLSKGTWGLIPTMFRILNYWLEHVCVQLDSERSGNKQYILLPSSSKVVFPGKTPWPILYLCPSECDDINPGTWKSCLLGIYTLITIQIPFYVFHVFAMKGHSLSWPCVEKFKLLLNFFLILPKAAKISCFKLYFRKTIKFKLQNLTVSSHH